MSYNSQKWAKPFVKYWPVGFAFLVIVLLVTIITLATVRTRKFEEEQIESEIFLNSPDHPNYKRRIDHHNLDSINNQLDQVVNDNNHDQRVVDGDDYDNNHYDNPKQDYSELEELDPWIDPIIENYPKLDSRPQHHCDSTCQQDLMLDTKPDPEQALNQDKTPGVKLEQPKLGPAGIPVFRYTPTATTTSTTTKTTTKSSTTTTKINPTSTKTLPTTTTTTTTTTTKRKTTSTTKRITTTVTTTNTISTTKSDSTTTIVWAIPIDSKYTTTTPVTTTIKTTQHTIRGHTTDPTTKSSTSTSTIDPNVSYTRDLDLGYGEQLRKQGKFPSPNSRPNPSRTTQILVPRSRGKIPTGKEEIPPTRIQNIPKRVRIVPTRGKIPPRQTNPNRNNPNRDTPSENSNSDSKVCFAA